jgi:short-subunit dehydrogenase
MVIGIRKSARPIVAMMRGGVLISGASSGLGRSVSVKLAEKGYTVFAGVRTAEDAVSLKQVEIAQIQRPEIEMRHVHIDIHSSTLNNCIFSTDRLTREAGTFCPYTST